MKRSSRTLAGIVVVAAMSLCLTACGTGELDTSGDGAVASQPTTVSSKSGTLATDSWGYTGINAVPITGPSQVTVTLNGHTLVEEVLDNGMKVVVSGVSFTKVSYSTDLTTLPAAAQGSAPAHFASYVAVEVGGATTTLPGYDIAVDAGAIPVGETVTVYNYNSVTRTWANPQTAAVSANGKISFQVSDFGLYGVFRSA